MAMRKDINVDIIIDAEVVLKETSLSEIIDFYGIGDILDEIGEVEAIRHFNLELKED